MNRDETIALFERCEAARAEAKKAALDEGKPEREARGIAHEAAKAIWNGWAEPLLAERKVMEAEGRWAAAHIFEGGLEAKNYETQKWIERAKCDFSEACFLSRDTANQTHIPNEDRSNNTTKILYAQPTLFSDFIFPSLTSFYRTHFYGFVRFHRVCFKDYVVFSSAQFFEHVRFVQSHFHGDADFQDIRFHDYANFKSVSFSGHAIFRRTNFSSNAWFQGASFYQAAVFPLVKFGRYANFDQTFFANRAMFFAIRGEQGFSLRAAKFTFVPDFIQAHFEEAPRLDNVRVEGKRLEPPAADDPENPPGWWLRQHRDLQRWYYLYRRVTMADHDIPARWRALKRLAIQAHDQDREHEFFSRELRSERFARDWPLPLARPHFTSQSLKWANAWPLIVWRTESWLGFFRFWFGKFYGLTSNYGRSVLRPGLWWSAGVLVAALFYLGEVDGMRYERQKARANGAISAHVTTALDAWLGDGRNCYEPPKVPAGPAPTVVSGQVGIIALSQELRGKTTASYEAIQLALRDGFLILYGDADTAHRTYGCLYGVELYGGGTPVAIVPPQVAFWSAMHKLWSAVMIFLFGLALRNMLKMK